MGKAKLAVLLTVCVLFTGCGYAFVKTSTLPAGLQTIYVEIFQNNTGQTGVETIFTNDVIYEFVRSGQGFVADKTTAEGYLTGTVANMRIETVSHADPRRSLERRVVFYVDVALSEKNGKVVWSANGLSDAESYYVVEGNKLATEKNQENAIRLLSRRLAEKIYYRLTENF